jgi:hypothetical protein
METAKCCSHVSSELQSKTAAAPRMNSEKDRQENMNKHEVLRTDGKDFTKLPVNTTSYALE